MYTYMYMHVPFIQQANVQASPTLFQSNLAPLQEIHQPSRRGHKQHTPFAHIPYLIHDTSPTIYSTRSHTRTVRILHCFFVDLRGKLSCGDKHQTQGVLLLSDSTSKVILLLYKCV